MGCQTNYVGDCPCCGREVSGAAIETCGEQVKLFCYRCGVYVWVWFVS